MRDVLVLCYHGLSDTWPAGTAVRPRTFERQMRVLLRMGYTGATFSDALTVPQGRRTVAVTFDDAHRSVLEHALPLMSRLGLPATVFVPTDYAGSDAPMAWSGVENWLGGPHERELACMSWEELGQLSRAGWEIGSHSRSHPRLTRLDEERLRAELVESRAAIEERLQLACTTIAYPYGDCDARVATGARDAGYLLGAAVSRHYEPPLPLRWPRVPVGHDGPVRFRRRVAPTFRRLGMSPSGRGLIDVGRSAKALTRRGLGR